MQKIGFLFFGRFEKEKGFDLILDVVRSFGEEDLHFSLPFEIYIFGAGSYEKDLLSLASRCKDIHYFGWQSLDTIKRYLGNIHYALMPSRFLETFGLVALNVLSWGVPVIGFKKGGLVPFIPHEYNLLIQKSISEVDKLKVMMLSLVEKGKKSDFHQEWIKASEKAKATSESYSKEHWFERFQLLVSEKKVKKILMVSDFRNKIGGIETYIHDVTELLRLEGYEVQIFGINLPKGMWGKLIKYSGFFTGMFNFWEAVRLRLFVKEYEPDLVWNHSILRYLGWFPLSSLFLKGKKKTDFPLFWMMYHDFGYFYPFPSRLTDVSQLKTPLTFQNYLKSSPSKNPFSVLAVMWKACLVLFLKKTLKKHMDLHLVPSEFMEEIVVKSYTLSEKKVKAFHHFIQE